MGCRRVAGDGKGSATMARRALWSAARRICRRLPVGRRLLFLRLSALGMAADVLYRRIAGITGHLRAPSCERIGSLEENTSRDLEPARSRDCFPLEIIHLSGAPDDDDELCLARNPGHVSDPAQTRLGVQSAKGGARHCV